MLHYTKDWNAIEETLSQDVVTTLSNIFSKHETQAKHSQVVSAFFHREANRELNAMLNVNASLIVLNQHILL